MPIIGCKVKCTVLKKFIHGLMMCGICGNALSWVKLYLVCRLLFSVCICSTICFWADISVQRCLLNMWARMCSIKFAVFRCTLESFFEERKRGNFGMPLGFNIKLCSKNKVFDKILQFVLFFFTYVARTFTHHTFQKHEVAKVVSHEPSLPDSSPRHLLLFYCWNSGF